MMEPSSDIALANAAPPRVLSDPTFCGSQPYDGMSKPMDRARRDEAARIARLPMPYDYETMKHQLLGTPMPQTPQPSLIFDGYQDDLRSFLRCPEGTGLHDPDARFPTIHEPPAGAKPRPRASSSLRAVWHRLKALNARFEDSWAGDLVGALCLVGIMVIVIFLPLILGEVYP